MSTTVIDTDRILGSLRATGKTANFTAEEIAQAFDAGQEGTDLLTRAEFGVTMAEFDSHVVGLEVRVGALEGRMGKLELRMDKLEVRMDKLETRMGRLEARMDVFEVKLDALQFEIRAEIRSSQVQTLLWLSGLILVSNGALIGVLARALRVV